MALLAAGASGAAGSVGLMATHPVLGVLAAAAAFLAVGLGVGAAGTSLLTLLAGAVVPRRRGPAATIVWLYRGGQDTVWLRRVAVAWPAVDAIAVLRDANALADWGLLVALYPGW